MEPNTTQEAAVVWIQRRPDGGASRSAAEVVTGLRERGERVVWLDEENLARLLGPDERAEREGAYIPIRTLVGVVRRGVTRGITFVLSPSSQRTSFRDLLEAAVPQVVELGSAPRLPIFELAS